MKKITSLLLAMILIISLVSMLSSCSIGVDNYELCDIDLSAIGLNVSVDTYEFNYISFNNLTGTYTVKNQVKYSETITEQSGDFWVDDDGIVHFSHGYILYSGETAYFSGDKLYVEADVEGYGMIYMVFEK